MEGRRSTFALLMSTALSLFWVSRAFFGGGEKRESRRCTISNPLPEGNMVNLVEAFVGRGACCVTSGLSAQNV